MGLRINQNIAAQNAYRNLSVTDGQMSKSLEKLSSGFRINRAADDAAGLAISEGLRSQVGGLKVAVRNAQDGVSVVQTAEGAMTEVHAILQRMRDLGVQAGNDSNNGAARTNIQTEVNSLVEELTRIGDTTNFNGIKLLDGSANGNTGRLQFQVGADGNSGSAIEVDLNDANVSGIATRLNNTPGTAGTEFATTGGSIAAGTYGFSSTKDGVTTSVSVTATAGVAGNVNNLAAELNADATFAARFTASVDSGNLRVQARNGGDVDVDGTSANAGLGLASAVPTTGLRFDTHTNAQTAVRAIDTAIGEVSTARAKLGALQNRFEHTINNTNVAIENLSASESRIRDTDMAQEMVAMSRAQILSQAGTAMLAQANQSQQGVLSLLR